MKTAITIVLILLFGASVVKAQSNYDYSRIQQEKLDRGFVAVRSAQDSVALSWRYLSSDLEDIAFDIYRDGNKINVSPISETTFYIDRCTEQNDVLYTLKSIDGSVEANYKLTPRSGLGYIEIPLNVPEPGVTPAGERYTYNANDASVGDVDGDGQYEIILKWEPSNAHDNAHDGYTGNVIFDCYTLSGDHLWRINLGHNIRAGAHYTQFMVYDLDGDGCAEVVMKTADGTIDGCGNVIGDAQADYRCEGNTDLPRGGDFPPGDKRGKPNRNTPPADQGRILSGPEYLTVFCGRTGQALTTIDYQPPRGELIAWGDNRANRSDRFLAAIGYLDGVHPSVIMCRGYYTRTVLAAYDWDGENLVSRWVFDSNFPGNEGYAGQGNHNLRVADVDYDGCDEIIYGQCAIDHDGKGLYTTHMGHGDAMHLTQFTIDDPNLYVWGCHENKRDGSSFRDARTGDVLWQVKSGDDVGRCMAADIDSINPGVEMWSVASGGIRNVKGDVIAPARRKMPVNSAVWWDGDLCRELLDYNCVSKYDSEKKVIVPFVTFEDCVSNNGTKANACLSGDIIGDWREEILLRTPDNKSLRLYTTTIPTNYRFHTLLEDIPYRISIATENVAYNQPPQPGFYFGPDFKSGTKVRGTLIK